jgi:hypothetical protein
VASDLASAPSETDADPDLARIVAAWPSLPLPIRRAILAIIQSGS